MKVLTGKVISDKMQKTAVVAVERFATHPLYQKRIRRTSKYHVRNEAGAKIGDEVKIIECKPLAKTVSWKISQIIKKYVTT